MKFSIDFRWRCAVLVAMCGPGSPLHAQQEIDRADPAVAEREIAAPLGRSRASAPAATITAPTAAVSLFEGEVPVGAVVVDGARTLRAAEFAPVIAPFVGRRLGTADLKMLAQGVADLARTRGYVFASAWVPRQAVTSGVLHVRLDEGRIDEVRMAGTRNPAAERMLAMLSDGRPVTRARLERALLLAGDIPGVTVANSTYRREGTRGVLLVESRSSGVSANAQIDNRGSRAVGPVRVRIRADAYGAISSGDQLTIRGTVTPIDPRELGTLGFDYALDTGADGLLAGIGASYTRVRPGRRPIDGAVDGRSASFNANLSYPIKRTLDANLWVTADLTLRDVEQDLGDTLIRSDRLTTLTLGASGYRSLLGGSFYGRVAARQGLNVLDATRRGDPLASRGDGSGIFTKFEAYADWTSAVSGPLSVRVAADGQLASRALLSSEEMGIGGPGFGRGYDYSERSGDRGIAGLIELRYDLKGLPLAGRKTQLYAFGDAGTVGNIGAGGRGGGLYSAGAGVRFDLAKAFDAAVEIGFPIGHDRFETRDLSPRLSFTMTSRF